MLAFYQLWLDDLYPKAKFLDALSMVEKLGHKKRMHNMRMEWISESKPRSSVHNDSIFDLPFDEADDTARAAGREKSTARVAPIFEKNAEAPRPHTPPINTTDHGLYDVTPTTARISHPQHESVSEPERGSIFGPGKSTTNDEDNDAPPEDDLDALLAEEEDQGRTAARVSAQTEKMAEMAPTDRDDFDDDMEAMDGMW